MTKRRGYSVIDPNATPTPAREPTEFRPLTISPAMRIAWERARAVQPPMTPLAGRAGMPQDGRD